MYKCNLCKKSFAYMNKITVIRDPIPVTFPHVFKHLCGLCADKLIAAMYEEAETIKRRSKGLFTPESEMTTDVDET